jgi:2-polyprenyl-3-methyl-5-hydroxy-6-metoxy-1,4-benzoquinol methylase
VRLRVLLCISTTRHPATDLGWLLHKHPARVQAFELAFGRVHVFYPEATDERCTAALVLDVDPVGLVRRRGGPSGEGFSLRQYVNDRPYVASSFLSVAIGRVCGTALGGRCQDRPELVDEVLPLEAKIAVLPCRGGEAFLRKLFEPLGYEVVAEPHALDAKFSDWGDSSYFTVTLRGEQRLCDLLTHLYVLIPVLDNDKHYWVGEDELEKLLRKGEGWLAQHPERAAITRRYLKHQRGLARAALARLAEEDQPDPDAEAEERAAEEAALEATVVARHGGTKARRHEGEGGEGEQAEREGSLHTQRLAVVLAALRGFGAKSVVDLGCGEGKLLRLLLEDTRFERILGMDVTLRSLKIASERLRLERLPPTKRARIELLHGSLTYRDSRLAGFDAAACVEVVEHLDPPRLAAFERAVFEFARPQAVVITTPNREYNVRFETLPAGQLRHRDHRFEWTRAEFEAWATGVAARFGYDVRFLPVGPEDAEVGSPTQMGVFVIETEAQG